MALVVFHRPAQLAIDPGAAEARRDLRTLTSQDAKSSPQVRNVPGRRKYTDLKVGGWHPSRVHGAALRQARWPTVYSPIEGPAGRIRLRQRCLHGAPPDRIELER